MEVIRNIIYGLLPRPQLSAVASRHAEPAAKRLLILSRYPNPSVSYYLDERTKALSDIPVIMKGIDEGLEDVDGDGLFVIICRYIREPQLRWLEDRRGQLAGVAYFVDDDIPAVLTGDEASWPYKFTLLNLAVRPLPRVNRLLTHLWTSTETLADTLAKAGHRIEILAPMPADQLPISPEPSEAAPATLKMIYHGTGVHRREHEFLMPIVSVAMKRHTALHFEVFAEGSLARQWSRQDIDATRITVHPPLPWSSYLEKTTDHGADIALAPLLRGKTNNSRSDTKRIDICRMGAAAIFSQCPTFTRCAVAGEIHVGNTAEEWLAAIDQLVSDTALRLTARNATKESIGKMRQSATPTFPGIRFDALGDMA